MISHSSPTAHRQAAGNMQSTVDCDPYSIDDGSVYLCGPFVVCPGQSVTVDGCGKCTGDEGLALVTASTHISTMSSSDGCGSNSLCAKFTYAVPMNNMCQGYNIQQYCAYGTKSCSGSVSYTTFPSVTSYVQYFEEPECSDDFSDSSGGLTNGYECSAIDDTGRYARVTCEGNTADSAWTAVIYPNPQCTGAYFEKILGSDSCDCHALDKQGYLDYSLRVNCAGVAPSCNTSNNNNGHNTTVFIIVIVAGGVAILTVLYLSIAYCRGWLKCSKSPTIAEAEPLPDPSAPLLPVAYADPSYIR